MARKVSLLYAGIAVFCGVSLLLSSAAQSRPLRAQAGVDHPGSERATAVAAAGTAYAPFRYSMPAWLTEKAPQTKIYTGTVAAREAMVFAYSGDPLEDRSNHSATLLPEGRVLVVGGSDLATAELYDPTSGTWRTAGSLGSPRTDHTATLLPNGRVLVVGGLGASPILPLTTAELYDPTTGSWRSTTSMTSGRYGHTATLLPSGNVLVVGGCADTCTADAELFNPTTETWSPTGTMTTARYHHTSTLLRDGEVLVTAGNHVVIEPGGYHQWESGASAELYDPATGEWAATGSLSFARARHTATLLPDGRVLVVDGICNYPWGDVSDAWRAEAYDPATHAWSVVSTNLIPYACDPGRPTATLLPAGKVLALGGTCYYSPLPPDSDRHSALLYDPVADLWSVPGNPLSAHNGHTTTLLSNGKLLVAGGGLTELGTYMAANVLTGTLYLPSGWITRTNSVTFVGTTSMAELSAGSLANDGTTWGSWLTATNGVMVATPWDFGTEGSDKPVCLRLRDARGQEATVVTGTVNVDVTPAYSSMATLPETSAVTFPLSWSGSDGLSGVSSYDVQVRAGDSGVWTDVLSATTEISTTYSGVHGETYYFRVRTTDVAGNVEAWPEAYDTLTLVDTAPPVGGISANEEALATTCRSINLALPASDALGGVVGIRLRADDLPWDDWAVYAQAASYTLPAGDMLHTVSAQYRDEASNVSAVVSDTIRLDEAAGMDRLVSINRGALWTNTSSVTLTVGAPAGTTQMQISYDGGFGDVLWQPFDTRPSWTLVPYGSYTFPRTVFVRVRGPGAVASPPYTDDIIYDPVPPVGNLGIVSISPTAVRVFLSASDPDNLSGVAAMRVGLVGTFAEAAWEPYATVKTLLLHGASSASVQVLAQFRDGAGNLSIVARAGRTSVFLPMLLR